MASVLIYTLTVSGSYGELFSYYSHLLSPPAEVDSGYAASLSYSMKGLPSPYWGESGQDRVLTGSATRPFTYLFRLEKSSGLEFSGMSASCPSDDVDEAVCFREFEDEDYTYLLVGCPTQMSASGRVTVGLSFAVQLAQQADPDPAGGSGNIRAGGPFEIEIDGVRTRAPRGTILRFASMAADALTIKDLPVGLVSRESVATVRYNGTTVFRGTPSERIEKFGKGTIHREDVTFEGPWGNLSRYVFRQEWSYRGERNGAPVELQTSTARAVLNVRSDGRPMNMTEQIREIASYAAGKCGFAYSAGAINAGTQILPADEVSDVTCAAAIIRTLRFFPRMLARFDYSAAQPVLRVAMPSTADADWLSDAKVLSRSITRKNHPIVGVEISTSHASARISVGGTDFDTRRFETQRAGDTDSLDCLHLYMPLEKGHSSFETEKLDCVGHVRDFWDVNEVKDRAFFWCQYHPRLRDVPQSAVTIENGSVKVVDPLDPSTTVVPFSHLTDLTVGDLRHFGQDARACRFVCRAKIEEDDDVEEKLLLTMDFVTTNAVQRTYTQTVSMSSEEGESLPPNLAQAILDQRSGELESEDLVVRLPPVMPRLGDAVDGLFLQNMSIDCDDLTAELHFGHPNYLSAEEMRDLLSGFRGRSYTSSTISRENTDAAEDAEVETVGIQPICSTEFSPGKKSKTVIKQNAPGAKSITFDASGGSGGNINLKTADVKDGETMGVHTLTYTDAKGVEHEFCIMACSDINIKDTPCECEGGGGGGEDPDDPDDPTTDDTDDVVVLCGLALDEASHRLVPVYKKILGVKTEDVDDKTPIFTAVEHTQGMDG